MSETALRFEDGIEELEALVERLESGERTLEQALADFERGVALVAACNAQLSAAELRVRELRPGSSGLIEVPIELDEDEA